jgi:hypothetical protein
MKVTFFEGEFGSNISMEPETIEEASALARMTLNAKANKPEIRHYFSEKGQSCDVWVKSVAKSVRKTSISNQR